MSEMLSPLLALDPPLALRRLLRTARVALGVAAAVLCAASSVAADPPPNDLPQIVCKTQPGNRGEAPRPGVYRFRPHTCWLHERDLSIPAAQLYAHIRWLHWGIESAIARAAIPQAPGTHGRPIHYRPVKLRFEAPLSACGHTVFSVVNIDVLDIGLLSREEIDRQPNLHGGCRG